uniref:Uncharacterized protein n=1 Tax=Denticeps clupeoides TaxID=299321 RepID=A0AAY4CQM4_9TELE
MGMINLIFISISSAIENKYNKHRNKEVIVALSLGHISSAHLNPAVTLGLLVSCQISVLRAMLYIIAQMLGAVVAGAVMCKLNGVTPAQGFGIELSNTFQLVLCVFATTDKRRTDVTGLAPLAIGLLMGLGHLAAVKAFSGVNLHIFLNLFKSIPPLLMCYQCRGSVFTEIATEKIL